MARLLLKRNQGFALRCLLLEMAARHSAAAVLPADFQTIYGEMVSYSVGEAALRNGSAVLIGGLLVGILPTEVGVEAIHTEI